jgi:hypothetical protein
MVNGGGGGGLKDSSLMDGKIQFNFIKLSNATEIGQSFNS